MKLTALFLATTLSLAFHVNAQNIPAPEFKNKVMYVNNGTLAELEKTDMATSLKTGMTGHSEVNLVADGPKASISHSGGSTDQYVVKIEPGIDPSTVVELFRLEASKKKRKVLVAEMSMGKDKSVKLDKVQLNFTKVSDGVYAMTTSQLESGEYAFMVNRPNISILGAANSQTIIGYCFSVPEK